MRPTRLDSARVARWFEAGSSTGEVLPERREAVCARRGNEVAIAEGPIRLRFVDGVDRLATGLAELGVTNGDVVSFQLPTW